MSSSPPPPATTGSPPVPAPPTSTSPRLDPVADTSSTAPPAVLTAAPPAAPVVASTNAAPVAASTLTTPNGGEVAAARASTRIAAKKRTAAELAEARKQKRRLITNKEAAAAAAALPFAVPLGPSTASDTASPSTLQLQPRAPGPSPVLGGVGCGDMGASANVSESAATAAPAASPSQAMTTPKAARSSKAPKTTKSSKAASKPTKAAKTPKKASAPNIAQPTEAAVVPASGPSASPSGPPAAVAAAPAPDPSVPAPAAARPPASALPAATPPDAENSSLQRDSPATTHVRASGPVIDVDDSDSEAEFYGGPPPLTAPSHQQHHWQPATREGRAAPPADRAPMARPLGTTARPDPARSAFDLSDFLSRYHTGAAATPTATARADAYMPDPRTLEDAGALALPGIDPAALFAEFTRFLQSRVNSEPAPSTLPISDTRSWALPNDRGVLPPAAIRNLRAADFPPPAYRTRGDFVPAAVHNLAAHRLYPFLLSPEGTYCTPMEFVLRMRLLDCLRFNDCPPILSATHSARFGRYGLTIMHYHRADQAARLAAGSSDANYSLDFGSNVAPPPAPACDNYTDLLGAIQGLITFANAEWYEPMAHALYRVRDFVTANMDADPGNTPQRVQRTLHEVNQFLGAAFIHLASDSPTWWKDFCAAVHRITFTSASWAVALSTLAPAAAPAHRDSVMPAPPGAQRRVTHDSTARNGQARPQGFPASMRNLIPRNAEGQEPCLRFFAGSMCFGGTASTCAATNRLRTWPDALPPALLAFIKKKFSRHDAGKQQHRA